MIIKFHKIKILSVKKQPETRPISQEQLTAEVKGIYAGLVMIEDRCIEVRNTLGPTNDPEGAFGRNQN